MCGRDNLAGPEVAMLADVEADDQTKRSINCRMVGGDETARRIVSSPSSLPDAKIKVCHCTTTMQNGALRSQQNLHFITTSLVVRRFAAVY
jgi:hypothetical protein